ncbi:MAG TPA: molybdopterin-binding protein, partial [Candidatus Limnocylindria bacterium]
DDLTREAIAAAVGEEPSVDAALERELRDWFAGRGQPMPERNRKQAWLIASARAIPNPNGTAPGWDVRKDGKRVVAMPGVPREMTYMWEHHVEPTLIAGAVLRWRTLKLLGIGESSVEETLGDLVRSTAPTVATYAKNDGVHIRVTDKAADAATADTRIAAMEATIRERLGRYVWGADDDTLGSVIGGALVREGWRLATAESLSAGDIARTLVEALGSAQWYARGIVLPHADAPTLDASLDRTVEVRLVVPHGEGTAELVATTPAGVVPAVIRFGSVADGRRRALLAGLDLLRRVVAR